MRHRSLAPTLVLALLGCGSAADRDALERRPVAAPTESGWARVRLDARAQRAWPGVWLGDADGVPITYEVERADLWPPAPLTLTRVLLGRDASGQPSAEFTPVLPAGWQIRDREQLRVDLDLAGRPPWTCQARVERRRAEGPYLALEPEPAAFLFDLGASGRRAFFYLPWDARDYRLRLHVTQGAAPRIRGVTATACTVPDRLGVDALLSPRPQPGPGGRWTLDLGAPERLVGAELLLQPPVAPVRPALRVIPAMSGPAAPGADEPAWAPQPVQGLVWNLPALRSQATRLEFGPVLASRLEFTLPEGTRPERIQLRVRRTTLVFPGEAGRRYFLHTGGRVKPAPGNLGALPPSSRTCYAREPLALGPPEPDPQGLPRMVDWGERTRPWLPWATGLGVVILAGLAWRLLAVRPPAKPDRPE